MQFDFEYLFIYTFKPLNKELLNFILKCKKNISQDEIGKNISRTDDNLIRIQYTDELNCSLGSFIIKDIGRKFSSINGFFLDYLNAYNIPTGFKKLFDNSLLLQNHNRFPFYCKLLNVTDKRSSKIFLSKEGQLLSFPVIQLHYGCSKDNLVTDGHLFAYDLCSTEDLKVMKRICSKINAVLKPYFERRNAILAEVNCFFGKDDEKVFLVDDFTPLSLKVNLAGSGQTSFNSFRIRTVEDFNIYTDLILNLTNI